MQSAHEHHVEGEKHLSQKATLGTVRLRNATTKEIVLVPTPANDPNDPLNWCVNPTLVSKLPSTDCEQVSTLSGVCWYNGLWSHILHPVHRRSDHRPRNLRRGFFWPCWIWTKIGCQCRQGLLFFHHHSAVARHRKPLHNAPCHQVWATTSLCHHLYFIFGTHNMANCCNLLR